jgi:hypothetical protein
MLALLCFALGAATAHAQRGSTQPLREHVGTTVAYRVGIPTRWELREDGEKLMASNGRVMVILGAQDLVTGEKELDLPVSSAEKRRILTTMILGSDSLLLGLMDRMAETATEKPRLRCSQLAREVRELAGQHAGYMSLACESELGESSRLDTWFTVKDGVMYILVCAAETKAYAANELLFNRVRESLVLADAPPAGSPE